MKKISRILFRFFKISGIVLLVILLLLFLAPFIFPNAVSRQIKDWTNQSIRGELNFSQSRLSFFTHFPSLTLTLYDVSLKGSAPFQQDTLLSAEKLGFGVNLEKLVFDHLVSINKIYLNKADIHVLIDEKGQANYNIYVSDTTAKTKSRDSSGTSLHLEKIVINDSHLFYSDLSLPMMIQAEHLFYEGTGDLSQSIFDLKSHILTDSLNFTFSGHSYVRRKAVDARLVTRINTKTLSFIFQNNHLLVNKINLSLIGKLDFLENGYDMDFSISSEKADLYQLITILPPEYLDWLNQTTVKGNVTLNTTLKGKYISASGQMPDYRLQLNLQDGFVAYQDATLPVTDLMADAVFELPNLDPEKMHVKIDSLSFKMSNGFFRAKAETRGMTEPEIHAQADGRLNLQQLKKTLGLKSFEMQGDLDLHLSAQGKYAKKIIKTSLREKDTVIASIPAFDFQCILSHGFVKYNQVTQPLQHIFLTMQAACKDSDYRHAYFKIDTLHADARNDFIEGKAVIHASTDFPLDLNFKGVLDLADIRQVYPLDSMELSGKVNFNISSSGKYAPAHHLFPKTNARFSLKDGLIQTKYYPHPVEKINLELTGSDPGGDLKSLHLSVQPASLVFEGKPFHFQGEFKNFDDLNYRLSTNGELDLGKIYQVFARREMGVTGFIKINADFQGKQSDAKNGHYDLLKNSGTMDVRDLSVSQESFPKPFLIHRGHFRFDQDKMWFESFLASYGNSDLQIDGFVENVINYVLSTKDILKANFNLKSKNIDLNEFTVFASPDSKSSGKQIANGVILVPANLDLIIKASADRVLYNDMILHHFEGGVNLKDSGASLTETGFELIGCQVSMNGKYKSISPLKAVFEYQLKAKDFDVQRAYKEIKIFHDLASSAEHANGIISVDYSLSGKLNEKMEPVYPSLAGGGVLSVKNVQFKGWKLFNTVSSASGKTDLKDPDLSKIDLKSSIKNNLITIEKTKFKTGGFRIRFEGQTSFDNKVNFKMRIGLPPLGIIGIPLRITGNSNNPNIKMGKSDSDPLEEKTE